MSALPPIATAKADIGKTSCLLYPRKRTCAVHTLMSALGQKRTQNVEALYRLRLRSGCVSSGTKSSPLGYRVSQLLHRQPQGSRICSVGFTPRVLFYLALENLIDPLFGFR